MSKINREAFLELLENRKAQSERIDKLEEIGLSIWDSPLIEFGYTMFDKVIEAYFTEEGVDWIDWWLYEKNGDPETKAFDEDKDEIPMETMVDLWRYIKQYRK